LPFERLDVFPLPTKSRKTRLTGKREFRAVFADGRRFVTSEMAFYYTRNGLGVGRPGFVVGKKVFAQAVQRNRLKRRLRELFRRFADYFKGFDIMVVARRSPRITNFCRLAESFEQLAKRLGR